MFRFAFNGSRYGPKIGWVFVGGSFRLTVSSSEVRGGEEADGLAFSDSLQELVIIVC